MKSTLVSFFIVIILSTSCTKRKDECAFIPPTQNINVSFQFEPLQDSIVGVASKTELVTFLGRYPVIRDYIFRRAEYPNDSIFVTDLYNRFNNPHIDTLAVETKRVFGDLAQLKKQFTDAFTNIKYYYPDFVPPKVQTVISGLDTDLLVTDSLIIVSLDFYLGAGARYRPKMYDYLLKQYEKENIVPSCLLIYGISDRFNATSIEDKTVLADMIAYGKSYYFAKHMLPCVPDSIFMWYSKEEIEGATSNQDLIWARLIEDQVLYATSHMVKQKFMGERPKTVEVGDKCPGRIGQWVGWKIVDKYAETHPELALPKIMKAANADKLFKDSRYKPEKR